MEKPANQLIEETQETHDEVPIFSLELLRDKLEYFDVKANFFENQTLIINEIIYKIELKGMELLKEEQELTDKLAERAEVKKNLVAISKGPQKVKMHTKKDESLISTNVHCKLKPWTCTDCTKSKRIKT